MNDVEPKATPQGRFWTPLALALSQGLLWLVVGVVLLIYCKRFEKVYKDFKQPLPPSTMVCFNIEHTIYDYPTTAATLALMWTAINFGVAKALEGERFGVPRRWWFTIATVIPLSLLVIGVLVAT